MATSKKRTKKSKGGRPPVVEKREHVVAAKFTAAEIERVRARAAARRQPVSTSVALAALEDAEKAGH